MYIFILSEYPNKIVFCLFWWFVFCWFFFKSLLYFCTENSSKYVRFALDQDRSKIRVLNTFGSVCLFFSQFQYTSYYVTVAWYLPANLFTRKVNLGLRSRPKKEEEYISINISLVLLLLFYVLELFFIKIKTAVIVFSTLYLESTLWSLSLWASLVKYWGIKVRGRLAFCFTGLTYVFI